MNPKAGSLRRLTKLKTKLFSRLTKTKREKIQILRSVMKVGMLLPALRNVFQAEKKNDKSNIMQMHHGALRHTEVKSMTWEEGVKGIVSY